MGSSFPYLKSALLPAVVFGVAVSSAHAQSVALPPGQPILFSSPESSTVVSNLPSLAPALPESLPLGNTLQAPSSFDFNGPPVATPLPSPFTPAVSPAETLRLRDLLDRHNNWALMTPAEILGVTTPEKILGIQEYDAAGRPKNLTALERYLERRNQTPPANTNALSTWNFSDNRSGASNSINGGWGGPDDMASPLFKPALDHQALAGQNGNSGWSRLFGSSSPSPAVIPAQTMDMDQFRQLLKPGSSSAAAAAPALRGIKISLPQTPLDSGLGQPSLTPIGASFTPLNNGLGKPAGMPKLPSAWGLSYTSSPAAGSWAPQMAPWLSPAPQPLVVPQRKF